MHTLRRCQQTKPRHAGGVPLRKLLLSAASGDARIQGRRERDLSSIPIIRERYSGVDGVPDRSALHAFVMACRMRSVGEGKESIWRGREEPLDQVRERRGREEVSRDTYVWRPRIRGSILLRGLSFSTPATPRNSRRASEYERQPIQACSPRTISFSIHPSVG